MVFYALAVLLSFAAQPGEVQGPPAPAPRIVPERDCPEATSPDEIVVCGRVPSENSPFRVPREFRNRHSDEDSHASWTARVQDEEEVARFSGQTIGGSGYLQRSRQRDCEWRVAQQERQGRRPDCGASHHPDGSDDWQRQRR